MKRKVSFLNLISFWGVIFLVGLAILLIAVDVADSYFEFKSRAKRIRADFIEQQKQIIRREVLRTVDFIRRSQESLLSQVKQKVKNKANEAYAIVSNIVRRYKASRNQQEIRNMIVEILKTIRFENERGYFFIVDMKGKPVLFPDKMKGEKPYARIPTTILKRLIEIAKTSGEGLFEHSIEVPVSDSSSLKLSYFSYVRVFEPLNWIIGAGYWCRDLEELLREQGVLKTISELRFGKEGYIFVNRFNGDALVSNGKVFSGTKKLWEEFSELPQKTKNMFDTEYQAAMKPEGDYIHYSWQKLTDATKESPKVSFIYGIPELEWIVGAGVYLDDVEKSIALLRANLNRQIRTRILHSIAIVVITMSIFLVLLGQVTRRLKKDVSLFNSLLRKAAFSDELIDLAGIRFREFKEMARNANKMLEDKKRTRQELKNEKEQLFVTLRSIGDGVITTDTSGEIELMNNIAEKLTGWSFEEAKGKQLREVFHIVNEETREEVTNPVERVLREGHIIGLGNHTVLISRDGIEYNIADSAAPIKDPEGKVLGVVIVFRDVTEIYEKEKRIRQNKQFLESLFSSVQDGISVLDTELNILMVNDVMREWYKENLPLEGGKCYKKYHNKEKPCSPCPSLRCLKTGKTEMEIVPGPPGSHIEWIELYSHPIKDVDTGETIGVVEFVRDITEQEKLKSEVIKAEKLRSIGVLAGGIAHDFNNILTGVFGNIEIAKMQLSKDHSAYSHLEIATSALKRATNLTKQLLTFARGGEPILETLDVKSIIQETVEFNLSGSSVKANFKFPDDLWQVRADKGQISQVIANLVINAKEAMPEGGNLYIEAENIENIERLSIGNLTGNFVKITLRDEGVGIPSKYLDKIFDPYFSTKQTGDGLGLAIVYSIIKKHDGHITVESSPGVGTAFTLYLPAERASTGSEGHEFVDIRRPSDAVTCRILVVDDEEMIREVAGAMLGMLGHKVDFAKDGGEAVKKYKEAMEKEEPFHIVIMDLTIPGGVGGKEAAKEILSIDPDAKIIVSSGYSTDPVMANYLEYGFKGRLSKPFQLEELRKEVNRLMKAKYG